MYTYPMHRINRSPDASDGGGSLPAAATPTAADSTATPAAAAPEYLSKSDFESFRNEITGHLQKLTPKQQAAADAKDGKPADPTEPDVSKYDFSKAGELSRYNRDNYAWLRSQEKASEAQEASQKAQTERLEKSFKGHKARTIEYKKANPSYDADLKAHGPMEVENEVSESVFESEESAAIVHYFAKHKGTADELNQLALMGNTRAIDRRIGEIAAEIKAERKALDANAEAAAAKPPRQNFSKGSKGANHEPTLEERYERNRS